MEKPTLPTRKGFLKKAALTCAGFLLQLALPLLRARSFLVRALTNAYPMRRAFALPLVLWPMDPCAKPLLVLQPFS